MAIYDKLTGFLFCPNPSVQYSERQSPEGGVTIAQDGGTPQAAGVLGRISIEGGAGF